MVELDVEQASAARVGTTLKGKWVLEQLIGVGGMASVYAGRHKIGRVEAIKILHAGVAASPQLRARFEQEAHAVNSFRHPGVVEVRDIDTAEDGSPYLVMELLDGESLGARIRREPALELADVLRMASETLDVLAAAHARAIVHRDIKPDNLFVTKSLQPGKEGGIKVLDFGIARVRSGDAKAMATKQGVTLGTMAYMPPEQARGEEIDGRADIFAVGATMFRIFAKRAVHDAQSEAERVMKVLGEHAAPLATVVPSIPADVALVVDRALAYDRANRYPDATTMKTDVDAVARGERPPFASTAPPLPVAPPSSSLFSSPSPAPVVPKAPPPNPDTPTVVPQKVAANVPDVAPTRIVPSTSLPTDASPSTRLEHVTPANVPGAFPTAVSGAPSTPNAPSSSKNAIATPYRMSPASHVSPVSAPRPGAPAPPPSPLVMLAIGAGAVLALLTLIAIVFFLARAAQ